MAAQSIALHNKSDTNIFVDKIKIRPEEISHIPVLGSSVNLHIVYGAHSRKEWRGTVPTSTLLEVYDNGDGLNVYLDDEKIPQHIIDIGGECIKCSGGCGRKWILLILLLIIVACGFFLLKKSI